MKKVCRVLAPVLALTVAFSACGSTASNSAAASSTDVATGATTDSAATSDGSDKIVTMAINNSWDGFCPLASTSNTQDAICNTVFENLVTANGKGGFDGELCESYEIGEDYKTLTVHIDPKAVWQDGEPVTADDIIFTCGLYTDGSYTTSRRLFFKGMEGCDETGVELSADSLKIDKVDDTTVTFYYTQPRSETSMFTDCDTFFILPEHLLKDADPATILENDFWVNPVGSGPFTFESIVPGDSVTVKAFADYHKGSPKFGTLVLKTVTATNLTTSMMSKEVDIIPGTLIALSDSDFELASTIEGYEASSIEGTAGHFLILNNEVFSTPTIRKAIAMMMDKQTMIQAGCYGNGNPLYTMYGPNGIYLDEAVEDELGYDFDPETAFKMLQDEGFDFDRTYTVCINDMPVRQAMMTVMQETWSKYGMKLEIKTLDTQTCISETREGNCDMWINGSSSAVRTDMGTWFANWCVVNADGSYGTFNLARIQDTTLSDMETKLAAATDVDEIKSLTGDVQRQLLTDYNYIWMISPFINIAISDKISNIDMDAFGNRSFDYWNWEVA